jgi:hypothetical protein
MFPTAFSSRRMCYTLQNTSFSTYYTEGLKRSE